MRNDGTAVEANVKLEWVKKRDGRIVPFRKEKISQAIDKALKTTGKEDPLLAQEMAEAVTLYLIKSGQSAIPDIETIQDTVERVLVEMKLFTAAKAYILYRDKRARLRTASQHIETSKAFLGSKGLPWNREKMVRALLGELQISRRLAEHVADIVEENFLDSGQGLVPPDQLDLTIH